MGRAQGVVVACVTVALAACSGPSSTAPSTQTPTPTVTAAAVTLTPNSWDLPAGGGSVEITIATSANAAGNVIAPNVAVRLQASSGSLSDSEPRTDNTGHARVIWSGTSSATITATAGDVQGTANIRVPAAAPNPPTPTPTPTPGPSPNPSPSPSPGPPSTGPLFVEITASPRLADEATPVAFSAAVRGADGTPQPTGLTYAWDFTEDGAVDSTSATPTYQFRARDHWTVTLAVRSADGRQGVASIEVVVGAIPAPTVSVTLSGTPSTIEVGQTVTFTANASSNAQAGAVTSYASTFGDGATATTTTPSTTHPYTTIGSFIARVTASTANGANGSGTVPVRVTDFALVVGITVSGTQTAPAALTFTATLSSAGGVPTSGVKYDWDFNNDGTTDLTQTGGSPQSAASSFNTAGTYKVKVTVTAPDGRTATNTLTIVVS